MYAILTNDSSGGVVLKTPYDPVLLEKFKDAVPYTFREWDRENKVWRIHADYGDVVHMVLENYGATITDRRQPLVAEPGGIPPELREALAVLCVTSDAPLEVCEAAYKALARKHHPDLGGDHTTMQLLNEAIATIKAYEGTQ